MEAELIERLSGRITMRDIAALCAACEREDHGEAQFAALCGLALADEGRAGYNALWVLTHLSAEAKIRFLAARRDELTDALLATGHTGRRRLLLSLLEALPTGREGFRTDYLDFCLAAINSTEPYGVRALCMKQAYAQCRFYPELLGELSGQLELLGYGAMSPGLAAARRNIVKLIESALRKA